MCEKSERWTKGNRKKKLLDRNSFSADGTEHLRIKNFGVHNVANGSGSKDF
jgi:hypothetical protein